MDYSYTGGVDWNEDTSSSADLCLRQEDGENTGNWIMVEYNMSPDILSRDYLNFTWRFRMYRLAIFQACNVDDVSLSCEVNGEQVWYHSEDDSWYVNVTAPSGSGLEDLWINASHTYNPWAIRYRDDTQLSSMNYGGADTLPTFSGNKTNSTRPGEHINFSINIADDNEISAAIFSLDNATGTFVNLSTDYIGASDYEYNNIYTISDVNSSTIRWQVFANDSVNQWSASDIFTFISDNTTAEVLCNYDCSVTHTIVSNVDCLDNNLVFYNSGSIEIQSNISNWDKLIASDCRIAIKENNRWV